MYKSLFSSEIVLLEFSNNNRHFTDDLLYLTDFNDNKNTWLSPMATSAQKKTLVIHSVLLALNFFVTIAFCTSNKWVPKIIGKIYKVLRITDMNIQLFFCYICMTLGT